MYHITTPPPQVLKKFPWMEHVQHELFLFLVKTMLMVLEKRWTSFWTWQVYTPPNGLRLHIRAIRDIWRDFYHTGCVAVICFALLIGGPPQVEYGMFKPCPLHWVMCQWGSLGWARQHTQHNGYGETDVGYLIIAFIWFPKNTAKWK